MGCLTQVYSHWIQSWNTSECLWFREERGRRSVHLNLDIFMQMFRKTEGHETLPGRILEIIDLRLSVVVSVIPLMKWRCWVSGASQDSTTHVQKKQDITSLIEMSLNPSLTAEIFIWSSNSRGCKWAWSHINNLQILRSYYKWRRQQQRVITEASQLQSLVLFSHDLLPGDGVGFRLFVSGFSSLHATEKRRNMVLCGLLFTK